MTKQFKDLCETAIEDAKREGKIKEQDILADLLPLLEEYIIGTFDCSEKGISVSFLNGQKFIISVKEI